MSATQTQQHMVVEATAIWLPGTASGADIKLAYRLAELYGVPVIFVLDEEAGKEGDRDR